MRKIDFNMKIGKPNKPKNDINFFDAYRENAKAKNYDLKPIIIYAISFLIIIITLFAGIKITDAVVQKNTDAIYNELEDPKMKETLQEVNNNVTKNTLLYSYLGLIKKADSNIDKLRKVDSEMLKAIASSTPLSVTLESMNISAGGVTLNCKTTKFMDQSLYIQQLAKTKVFSEITSDNITYNKDESLYRFSLRCLY